jgi:hypothetical protein
MLHASRPGMTTGATGQRSLRNLLEALEEVIPTMGEADPRHHTQKMQRRLVELTVHLREDISKVSAPQLKATFETAAEALTGLGKAFKDDEEKNEAAWRS